ncbi:unnamed protein product, partial [Symbiodinium necroappetens]
MHRNLSVKKHNARDKASYLIPISDFKDGGLWVQLKTGEEVKEEDVVMTEEEWNTTSARYGANHYIAGMAARMVFVDDEGEELHVGSMMAMTTARVPSFEPGSMSSDWIKACKVHNAVLNIEANDLMKFVEVAEDEIFEEDD